ncbi:hypothetical protein [Streptomyces sp. NBC_01361]|nr:hypothetical protein [Streptomyces sp. NBC_01361]
MSNQEIINSFNTQTHSAREYAPITSGLSQVEWLSMTDEQRAATLTEYS